MNYCSERICLHEVYFCTYFLKEFRFRQNNETISLKKIKITSGLVVLALAIILSA